MLIFPQNTVCKLWKFTLTLFWKKFRESNVFTNKITKWLIWRDIFSVRVNVSFFHTVSHTLWKNEKFTLTEIFFRQINSLVIYLVNALLSRSFFQKSVRVNFHSFHTHCVPQKFRVINIFTNNSYLSVNWFHKLFCLAVN